MSNTRLWDELGRTDPSATKSFKRAGGFSGTAIKPMWAFKRMTEQFGPAGLGWGMNEPTFQVVQGVNQEVLVYCTVSLWYSEVDDVQNSVHTPVFGVGGDKVVTHIKANEQYNRPERWENDDEAFKKAYTDAITNALKLIGVGADVHLGLFDDNKYVNQMRQEFSEDQSPQLTPAPKHSTEPAHPKVSYNGYAAALIAATNLTGLQDTFKALWRDGSLTQGEKDNLKGQYERLRDKMAPKAEIPPSFDHLEAALEAGGAGTFKETHDE